MPSASPTDPRDNEPLYGQTPCNREPVVDPNWSSKVIGQKSAVNLLRGVFERHTRTDDSLGPVVLIGPSGCGKTTAVREVSEQTFRTFVVLEDVHLREADGNPCRAALSELRRIDPLAEGGKNVVILVKGADELPVLRSLIRTLRFARPFAIAEAGNKVMIDPSKWLWLVSFVPNTNLPIAAVAEEIETQNHGNIGGTVSFKQLSRSDIFAILTLPGGLLEGVQNRLARFGPDLELSEMAAWNLVNEAVGKRPSLGAHALFPALNKLELDIYGALLQTREILQCQSK